MKKEVILAIAIGFALGLVITFGIWTANKSLKNLPQAGISPTPSPTAASSPAPNNEVTNNQLTISSPDDETLLNTDTVVVSGQTTANSTLLVISEQDEQVTAADTSGNFSLVVDLVAGYNVITVYAYDTAGNESSKSLTVTYTTAKL